MVPPSTALCGHETYYDSRGDGDTSNPNRAGAALNDPLSVVLRLVSATLRLPRLVVQGRKQPS